MEVPDIKDRLSRVVARCCAWQSAAGKLRIPFMVGLVLVGTAVGSYYLYQITSWHIVALLGLLSAMFGIILFGILVMVTPPLLFCNTLGIRIWCDAEGLQWSHGSRLNKLYAWTDVAALRFGRRRLQNRPFLRRALHAIGSSVVTVEMTDGARLRFAPMTGGLEPHASFLAAAIAVHGKNSDNPHVPAEDWDYLLRVCLGEDIRTMRVGCIVAIVPLFFVGFAALAYWFEGEIDGIAAKGLVIAGGLFLLMPVLVPWLDRVFNGPKRI
ncbi:MAG: hypothetical protein HC888_11820 [Candidatus Competibacteraceae bacterium]|nr:hypothetical protein [Candidatus Competibacteraceae bacterium]